MEDDLLCFVASKDVAMISNIQARCERKHCFNRFRLTILVFSFIQVYINESIVSLETPVHQIRHRVVSEPFGFCDLIATGKLTGIRWIKQRETKWEGYELQIPCC